MPKNKNPKHKGYLSLIGRKLESLNSKIPEILEIKKKFPRIKNKLPMFPQPPIDVYEDHHLDGGLGKAALHKLTFSQELDQREKLKSYVNFIKSKLIDFDFGEVLE